MIIISFIGIGGILQKEIYKRQLNIIPLSEDENDTEIKEEPKYKNSSLNDEAKRKLIVRLRLYL